MTFTGNYPLGIDHRAQGQLQSHPCKWKLFHECLLLYAQNSCLTKIANRFTKDEVVGKGGDVLFVAAMYGIVIYGLKDNQNFARLILFTQTT